MDAIIERVDDIPLIIHMCNKLDISGAINKNFPKTNISCLDYGNVISTWISHILSESDHTKSNVEPWVENHKNTLSSLLGKEVDRLDFTDDRLSQALEHLSDDNVWMAIENTLYQQRIEVYDIDPKEFRLDGTTTFGYHETSKGGLLDYGFSKDKRSDLPQVKIMAAFNNDHGDYIASDIASGKRNDDVLYMPLINRIKKMNQKKGLLFSGDCKMHITHLLGSINMEKDFYIVPKPSPSSKSGKEKLERLIEDGIQKVKENDSLNIYENGEKIGAGYEIEQVNKCKQTGNKWNDRLIIYCSETWKKSEVKRFQKRLEKMKQELLSLTGPKGSYKPVYSTKEELENEIEKRLKKKNLEDCFEINIVKTETAQKVKRVEKRSGKKRLGNFTVKDVRYIISEVKINQDKVDTFQDRAGWRLYSSNLPKESHSLNWCVLFYNQSWRFEHRFHNLKGKPIGVRPLHVKKENQIKGLLRLTLLALMIFSRIEIDVREMLKTKGESLDNLFGGQPKKKTTTPGTKILLKTLCRSQITLIGVMGEDGKKKWHLANLDDISIRILELLGISKENYLKMEGL